MYDNLLDIFEYIIEHCKNVYLDINVGTGLDKISKKHIIVIDISIHIDNVIITLGFEYGKLNGIKISYKDIDELFGVISIYDNLGSNILIERINLLNMIIECGSKKYNATYNEYIEYFSYYMHKATNNKVYVYCLYNDIGYTDEEVMGYTKYYILKYKNQTNMTYVGVSSDDITADTYEVKELLTKLLENNNGQSKDSK